MNTGFFFKLDSSSIEPYPLDQFRYVGIKEGGHFPIYVTIDENELCFLFHSINLPDTIELLSLTLFDYNDPKGEFSQRINDIYTFHERFVDLGGKKNLTVPSNPILSYSNLNLESLNSAKETYIIKNDIINIKTIFLDFLFDLEHSDVFQNSVFFSKLKKILHQNSLLDSIISKYEYSYQLEFSSKFGSSLPKGHTTSTFLLAQAEEEFLTSIISDKNTLILIESPWFTNENLESELKDVRNNSLRLDQNSEYFDSKLVYKVSEWYLSRYYFKETWNLLWESHLYHRIFLILPFFFFYIFLYLQIFPKFFQGITKYWPEAQDWIFLGIGIIFLIVLLSLFGFSIFFLFTNKENLQKDNITSYNSLLFYSPQLSINIFLIWISFNRLAFFPAEGSPLEFFWIIFISLSLSILYLYKGLDKWAPDIRYKERKKRVRKVLIRTYSTSFLIGIVALEISPDTSELTIENLITKGNLLEYFRPILLKSMPVLLIALLVTFLLKGNRFTGWFPTNDLN